MTPTVRACWSHTGVPEVVLHEHEVVAEGLGHVHQGDQVARLPPDLPAAPLAYTAGIKSSGAECE